MSNTKPDREFVLRFLSYDPGTGEFRRLGSVYQGCSDRFVGKVAGVVDSFGYRKIVVGSYRYQAHHLAWLIMTGEWPPHLMDHINCVRDDNRWANLRLANRLQNARNKGMNSTNTSGYKGVARLKGKSKKWQCGIGVGNKRISLGYFDDPKEAAIAYDAAARQYFGEFARLNFPEGTAQ